MKNLISRPARGLLPLALAACALIIPESGSRAAMLTAALMLARLCSLCAGAAFRITAGEVVNTARLRGNFLTALTLTLIGGAACITLCSVGIPVFSVIDVRYAIAGVLLNISQLCSDRLYAAYDSFSPPLYDVITAALAAAGLLISSGDEWMMPVSVLPAALAGTMLLYGLRSGRRIKPGFGVIKCIPAAIRNNGLFQLSLAVFMLFSAVSSYGMAFIFAAIAIIECCESPFRRNDNEGAALNVAISVFSVAAAVCAFLMNNSIPASMFAILLFACIGALLTGVRISIRQCGLLIGMIVLTAFTLDIGNTLLMYAAIAAAAVIAALCTPDIVALKRVSNARRIQRRRRK